MSSKIAIGIDLGTTNSCVAVHRNGQTKVIENAEGEKTTPSYVFFDGETACVGAVAKQRALLNPDKVIFDAKRIIGTKFNEADVQKFIKTWPFAVKSDIGRPKYDVGLKEGFFPEEISQLVLSKMLETAQSYLKCEVKDAVITVPAYFTDYQRRATKYAAELAGINVLRLINEPTAAVYAYGVDQSKQGDSMKRVCVYDLGGGTFDVTIASIYDQIVEVLATRGIKTMGGQDFDKKLYDRCAKILLEEHGVDVSQLDAKLRTALLQNCELAKRKLSEQDEVDITCNNILPGEDNEFKISITRQEFNNMIQNDLTATTNCLQEALEFLEMEPSQIDQVLLVGGSTRIPKIEEMLKAFFESNKIVKGVNPDQVVAVGAAMHAAQLMGDTTERTLALVDITSQSIGVEILNGEYSRIIECNEQLPASNSCYYNTVVDNQQSVNVKVYQGENYIAATNHFLGNFQLVNLPPAKKGELKIEVIATVDTNGVLTITGKVIGTSITNEITVKDDRLVYSKNEQAEMMENALEFRKKNEEKNAIRKVRETFMSYLHSTKKLAMHHTVIRAFPTNTTSSIVDECNHKLRWLKKENGQTLHRLESEFAFFKNKNEKLVCSFQAALQGRGKRDWFRLLLQQGGETESDDSEDAQGSNQDEDDGEHDDGETDSEEEKAGKRTPYEKQDSDEEQDYDENQPPAKKLKV